MQFLWAKSGTPYSHWTPGETIAQLQAANPGWTLQLTPTLINLPGPGAFSAGTLRLSPLEPSGSFVDMVVLGWTGNYASLDAAMAGSSYFGCSSRFTTATGDTSTTPPGVAIPIRSVFPGLIPVPEPGMVALAVLGTAGWLGLRRR